MCPATRPPRCWMGPTSKPISPVTVSVPPAATSEQIRSEDERTRRTVTHDVPPIQPPFSNLQTIRPVPLTLQRASTSTPTPSVATTTYEAPAKAATTTAAPIQGDTPALSRGGAWGTRDAWQPGQTCAPDHTRVPQDGQVTFDTATSAQSRPDEPHLGAPGRPFGEESGLEALLKRSEDGSER